MSNRNYNNKPETSRVKVNNIVNRIRQDISVKSQKQENTMFVNRMKNDIVLSIPALVAAYFTDENLTIFEGGVLIGTRYFANQLTTFLSPTSQAYKFSSHALNILLPPAIGYFGVGFTPITCLAITAANTATALAVWQISNIVSV